MDMSEYVLSTIVVVVMFISFVVSTRRNGFIMGLGMPRAKYKLDKTGIESYCRVMLLVVAIWLMVGAVLSSDFETVFLFTAINTVSIGYAMAWEKIIKQKQ